MSDAVNPLAPQKPVPTSKVLRKLFLTLFLRGRSARGLKKEGKPTSIWKRLLLVLFFYSMIGMGALALTRTGVYNLAFYLHGMTLAFLGMFVAASTGELLFNKDEPDILLHRPVSIRELLWAKVSLMVEVSLWLAGAFNIGGFIAGVIMPGGGWMFVLVHAVSVVFAAMFTTALVVVGFQVCLKWFGREKLDGLITTLQIVMAVGVTIGAQLIPRLMNPMMKSFRPAESQWWMFLLPPAWFAGMDDAFAGSHSSYSCALCGVGVVVTLLLNWLAFSRLAGAYELGLQSMNSARTFSQESRGRRQWLARLVHIPPLSWWLRDSVARSSFLLCCAYLTRDRDVRLRVYPSISSILIMPVILFIQPNRGHSGFDESGGFLVAFAGSYLGLIPLMCLEVLQYSDQWQASDIFRTAPISGPGQISNGARRAVIFLITLPAFAVFGVFLMFLVGKPAQLLLMLPGIMLMPLWALIPHIGGRAIPLSLPSENAKAARRGIRVIAAMMVSMAVAGVAMLSFNFGFLKWMLMGEFCLVICAYAGIRASLSSARWKPL